MKDKIDRLFEAVEHPERFSDDEIAKIMEDSETRGIYDTMSKTADLLTETDDPDIDKEWKRFSESRRPGKIITLKRFMPARHAAAAIIAIVASLAVVAATIGFTHAFSDANRHETAQNEQPVATREASAEATAEATATKGFETEPEIRIFKDENLEQILGEISSYYGSSVTFRTPSAMTLRLYFQWDQSQPLDEVVEQLDSFEQIEINLDGNLITVE